MSNGHILDFVKESGSDEGVTRLLDNVLCYCDQRQSSVQSDGFSEAVAIRKLLIDNGFQYDGAKFLAQDVIHSRAGNCLGYSLLIGGLLLDRGFDVSFRVILHPKDAIHHQDQKLFRQLYGAEHFSYDNPVLPRLKDRQEYRPYRFAALEHPSLLIDGKTFEVTSLEDIDEDPGWCPESELVRSASFHEILSYVGIDKARSFIGNDGTNLQMVKDWVISSLNLWPENREGWLLLWAIASDLEDESLKRLAAARYVAIGGEDSRFFWGMYEMTGDPVCLSHSLERFPEGIIAFTERFVERETDTREAKFNLAVAACCVLNSSAIDLKSFYVEHEESIRKLYGNSVWKALFR